MNWKFWEKSCLEALPAGVRRALESEFGLTPPSLDRLRLVKQSGRVPALKRDVTVNKRVQLVRIFDPVLVRSQGTNGVAYSDFQSRSNRKALRFEGHIEKNGQVCLADRRQRRLTFRPLTLETGQRRTQRVQ